MGKISKSTKKKLPPEFENLFPCPPPTAGLPPLFSFSLDLLEPGSSLSLSDVVTK